MLSPTEVLSSLLKNPTSSSMSDSLVTPDITYVSLNFDNPDLKKIMPWAGTSRGPESTVKTFVDVSRYWEVQSFQPEALFGSEGYAAMSVGSPTSRSSCRKLLTTPFAVFAKVEQSLCTYMEDTFATGASFRSGGTWRFQSNPNGEQVMI